MKTWGGDCSFWHSFGDDLSGVIGTARHSSGGRGAVSAGRCRCGNPGRGCSGWKV